MPKTYTEAERKEIIRKLRAEANILMQQKGVKKTTVDELVSRAGIPKGTFYLFYPSKEMLLFDCVQQFHEQADDYLTKGLSEIFKGQPAENKSYSACTDAVTDVILGAVRITLQSCLKVFLDPANLELLLSNLPDEVLEKHRQEDRRAGGGIMAAIAEKKGMDIEALTGAFTMIILGSVYRQAVGEDNIDESTRLLIRGLVAQILE